MSTNERVRVYQTFDPLPDLVNSDHFCFEQGRLDVRILAQSSEEEERGVAHQNPIIASDLFETTRIPFRKLLRKMLEEIFHRFQISRKKIVDIGSGTQGPMVHQLLPLTDEERQCCIECDVNPQTVAIHKRRYPDAQMVHGSYLRLRESLDLTEGIDTISGLSCLDSTNHLDRAIESIYDSLAIGGHFIHMQDVRPGIIDCILKELAQNGYFTPYECVLGYRGSEVGMPTNPYGFVMKDLSIISTAELLRNALERSIGKIDGLRLLFNSWLMAVEPLGDDEFAKYFLGIMSGKMSEDKEKKAYAVVTVAQRVK